MKYYFLFFSFVFVGFVCSGQYTYFNNSFEGNITGTFQMKLSEVDGVYHSLGLEDFGISKRTYSQLGTLIDYDSTGYIELAVGSGNNIRDSFLPVSNGFLSSYANYLEQCFDSPTAYAGYALFNDQLDTVWTKTYPWWSICDTLSTGNQTFCLVDDESSALLSSMFYTNGNVAPIDSFAMRITTFENASGNLLSDHFKTCPYLSFSMSQMRYINGFYYVLGDVVFEETNPLDYQTLLVKVNENAEIVGELQFGNPNGGWEKWPQMEVDSENKIVLTYEFANENIIPQLNTHFQHSESRCAIIDPTTFTVEQDFIYSLPYLDNWIGGISKRCVLIDSQDNILILDGVTSFFGDPPQTDQMQLNLNIITKLNPDFEIIWQNEYFSPDFGSLEYFDTNLIDMIQTSDGGYLASGVSYSDCCQKHWLLKIDNCGYEQPSGCPAVISVEEQTDKKLQLWPNPFHNLLKAVLPQDAQRVFVTDMTGRIVFEEKVYFPNQQWDLSKLERGAYLFNVACEAGRVIGQRIVKQ